VVVKWSSEERRAVSSVRNLGVVILGATLLLTSCASKKREPDIAGLYTRAAQDHGIDRNPVIVIPGILGSRLLDEPSQTLVWGAFGGSAANPQKPDGARLLALPMVEGSALADLRDEVYPDGVLERLDVRLMGIHLSLQAYVNVMRTLGAGGYRDESVHALGIDYGEDHFTCFQFPYDWRRDLPETAARLHEFILEKRAYVQQEFETRYGVSDFDVKFDLVAHSMGGLLARYYLRYGAADLPEDGSIQPPTWAGSDYVEKLVLLGTPNAGSADALIDLEEGRKFGPMIPRYESAILGTMPAVYQLLPRDRHGVLVDATDPSQELEGIYDPEFWQRMGWGLADPDQDHVLQMLLPAIEDPDERRRIALDHQGKALRRARQFAEAMDLPVSSPESVQIFLVAGDAEPTDAVMAVDQQSGELEVFEKGPGDGTVLRSSALMDERTGAEWSPHLLTPIDWAQVTFLFSDHLGMTKDPAFADNVLYYLLESPK